MVASVGACRREMACAAGRDQEPADLNASDRSFDCSIVLYQRITNPAEAIPGQKADLQQEIAEYEALVASGRPLIESLDDWPRLRSRLGAPHVLDRCRSASPRLPSPAAVAATSPASGRGDSKIFSRVGRGEI